MSSSRYLMAALFACVALVLGRNRPRVADERNLRQHDHGRGPAEPDRDRHRAMG